MAGPPLTSPFAANGYYQNPFVGTLAQLYARQSSLGGQLWQGLGQQVGATLADIAREHREAPILAEQAALRAAQMRNSQSEADARTAQTAQQRQAAQLEREKRDVSSWLTTVERTADPAARERIYQQGRERFLQAGLWDETDAPPQYDAKWARTSLALLLPKEAFGQVYPDPPKLTERDPTKDLIDPTGNVVRPGTPEPAKITFGQPQPYMLNGRRILARSGSDNRMYDMQGNVIASALAPDVPPTNSNGEPLEAVLGPDGNPVLVPRSQAVGRRPASSREQGRPVTSGDAGRIADFDTALDDLATLRGALTETKGATGTMAALGASLPAFVTDATGWGTDAKKRQGVIDRVKQVIGKTLEGGVLRKEDEYKYEKILPTIRDTAEIAASKLAGLEVAITQRRSTFIDDIGSAGFETSRFPRTHTTSAPTQDSMKGLQPGHGRKFTAGPFAGQTWGVDDAGRPYRVQ